MKGVPGRGQRVRNSQTEEETKTMSDFRKSFAFTSRLALSLVVGGSVLLAGCNTNPSSSVAATTQANYYPACYEPVSHLRSSESAMTRSVVTGAIAGGLLGAVAGAVAGDSDDRGRNVAIGAAGGALVGGAAAYYNERQNQIADDRQRIASYAGDFSRTAGELDRSVAYASAAQSCYQREFSALRDGRKSGAISDSEGRSRLNEIVSGLQETNALLAKVDGRVGENVNTYTQAYEQDLQQVGVQRQVVAEAAKTPVATQPRVVRQVPQEAVTTERAVQQVQTKRAESREVASRGRSMVTDVCNNPDMGDWAPPSCSKA